MPARSVLHKNKKQICVNGFYPAQARGIAKFVFGSAFQEMITDEKNLRFVFIVEGLKKDAELLQIAKNFEQYWGANWSVQSIREYES